MGDRSEFRRRGAVDHAAARRRPGAPLHPWTGCASRLWRLPRGREDRPVDRTIGRGLWSVRIGLGWLGSLLVAGDGDVPRDLSGLVVPRRGCLEATGDLFQPYWLRFGPLGVAGSG